MTNMINTPPEPVDEVVLRTADDLLVCTRQIPRFTPAPKVLLWGIRVFVQDPDAIAIYREAFYYAIPDPAP